MVANLANPGNSSRAINLLVSQRGVVGLGRARTLPGWLLPRINRRIAKDRTGSDLDKRPLYIQYVTKPGDSCGQINPFFLARRRLTVDHSLMAGGGQRQWLQACLLG